MAISSELFNATEDGCAGHATMEQEVEDGGIGANPW